MKYTVIDTPMRPARYKVIERNKPFADNSTHHYFRERGDANTECVKRNNREAIALGNPQNTTRIKFLS